MQVETEYGLRPHPYQGFTQAIHIVLSPFLVFSFGLLFKDHILKMYKSAHYKRKTGLILSVTMFVMIISGYGLQVIYAEFPKLATAYLHLGVSLLFTIAYLIHHLFRR